MLWSFDMIIIRWRNDDVHTFVVSGHLRTCLKCWRSPPDRHWWGRLSGWTESSWTAANWALWWDWCLFSCFEREELWFLLSLAQLYSHFGDCSLCCCLIWLSSDNIFWCTSQKLNQDLWNSTWLLQGCISFIYRYLKHIKTVYCSYCKKCISLRNVTK